PLGGIQNRILGIRLEAGAFQQRPQQGSAPVGRVDQASGNFIRNTLKGERRFIWRKLSNIVIVEVQRVRNQAIDRQRPLVHVHSRLAVRRGDIKLINRGNRAQRRLRPKLLVALNVNVSRPKSICQRTVNSVGQQNSQSCASCNRDESAAVHAASFDCTTTRTIRRNG